ncbi:type II secretion system F family protein [Streptomyces sp. KL118A]|uniref:type II secretion system F family protein n=1 Tax=Streptomyces sp. KL118A TaxID=3045153 RepID=UPI00278C26C1|nr:type II secretion system F family protein [Streptomyces sp. KL118A]
MNVFHRLGVIVWVAVALLWLALTAVAARRERTQRRRAEKAIPTTGRPAHHLRKPRQNHGGAKRDWLLASGTASATYALLTGLPGALAAAAVGYLTWRHCHQKHASAQNQDQDHENAAASEAAHQLPLAADLLAACIASGANPMAAAHAVGESLQGPVGARLSRGAAEVRLGGDPAAAWRHLSAVPGAAPLARLLERAGDSGAPTAAPVARLAADARATRARAATAGARRAAVLMTAPVGLCFLPAFVAVGVLPVVMGLAEGLLSTD